MSGLVRISTGARLHFGLLDVAEPFGGCGVMTDRPETIVEARPAATFRCATTRAGSTEHLRKAEAIAGRLMSGGSLPEVEVRIVQAAPSHNGLGSGTQLSLAIAEAILLASHGSPVDRERLIAAADRGLRSAVGTHGYFAGGFIAEGLDGHESAKLNRMDQRLDMPSPWRAVVLLLKRDRTDSIDSPETVSGSDEQAKFDQLAPAAQMRENLKRIMLDEIVPAIRGRRFEAFGDAVTRYNRSSGELFAAVQGGPYNGAETSDLIAGLLKNGHVGVGQSSWGPGVFVWFSDPTSAWHFCDTWTHTTRDAFLVSPKRSGRTIQFD
ncbi:GHMP family kinase ATP-binding protein [Neorhodopirellula pilleata]|uniref:Uncharacterized protein n=1 Tax=Neorhodopirellula pilleata TaxID=2714738 RepID=A0A5C6A4Z2_9BACT|nr:beta-ribofuranosylaminobenzene 5'-phosphate synthase [Neorhodopirellula pilleata]TWT94368.1 hypothetical protein Pla100_39800 [Neorhodopirellula pilleata]